MRVLLQRLDAETADETETKSKCVNLLFLPLLLLFVLLVADVLVAMLV